MNDLISRQAAIKAIEDLPNCYNGFSDTYDKACIIGVLEELPSAQSERPEGHWVIDRSLYKCSNCNHIWSELWWVECCPLNRMNKIMKFCPNCGAKMAGEEV